MEAIGKHVEGSGAIAICPEGQISKNPPHMQSFRRGSFGVPIQFEMPIWGMVMHGCYDGWSLSEVQTCQRSPRLRSISRTRVLIPSLSFLGVCWFALVC